LLQFSSGELPASAAAALREHVLSCDACGQILASFKGSTLSVAVNAMGQPIPVGVDETPNPTSPTLSLAAFTYLLPPEQPGEIGRLGPYRILKVLGEGGMGVVFQAHDPVLERLVALKVMKPDGATEVSRQRFLQEGKVAAKLQHDHIVTIYQVGEDRGVPYLAMQFLEGEALDRRLKRDGKLPIREVLRIGREVAAGLAAAHARNLIHRDIKPANIWLESQPNGMSRVKILDFGLARAVNDNATHLTRTGVIMGTPDYMAPEQARGQVLDPRCDIFSLGCVMYHMATGKKPFHGEDVMATLLALATEDPIPLRQHNPDVPWELEDRVKAMMAKNPGDRPASATAVVEELTHLEENVENLSKSPVAAPRQVAPPPAPGGAPRVRKTPRRTVNPGAASIDDLLRGPAPNKKTEKVPLPPLPKPADSGSTTAPLGSHGLSGWSGEQGAPPDRPASPLANPPATPRRPSGSPLQPDDDPTSPLSKSKVALSRPMAPVPTEPPASQTLACPKCGSKRFKGGPMGWCQACGYSPNVTNAIEPKMKEALEKRREERSLAWLTIVLLGAFLVVIATFLTGQLIRANTHEWKIWVWFQFTAGTGSFMLSILWTYVLIRNYNDDQSFLPIFCKPIYFMQLTWQLHYRTRHAICLGIWGIVMTVAIFVVVGDPYYWLYGGRMQARVPTYKIALEKAIPKPINEAQVGTFTVIGFRLENGAMTSVLLAAKKDGRYVYMGTSSRVADTASTEGITTTLIDLLRADSVVPGLNMGNVKWVEPKVSCEVQYTSRTEQGLLIDPVVLSWK
jgi:serine/threonine protein kinase